MDVRSSFIFTLTFPLVLTLSACDQPRREEVVFPKATAECQSSALKNQYLVRWADGHISQERGANREIFMESFLRPQLQKIDRVEHDQYIQLEPTNESDGEDNDSPVPDNWAIDKIGVAQAWAQGIRGQGIVVAVIDSGVDIHHPQLKDQIFHNPGEVGVDESGVDKSTNGIDDDGNGLIDDVNGYDFNQQSGSIHDNSFHGTHIAGIIAAEHNDTSRKSGYVQGVAPAAKILPLTFIDSTGRGTLSEAILAIDYATQMGAQIINASWGAAPCSKILRDKIASLSQLNILFITAAGNRGVNIDLHAEYPAAYNLPAQVTVGALGPLNLIAEFSNFGDRSVHIFAPGQHIVSTVPGGFWGDSTGTSMATPFVSGVAALIGSSKPEATASEIRASLLSSIDKDPSYRNSTQGRLYFTGN